MERGRGRKLVNLTWRQEGEGVWGGEEGEEQECYDRLGSSSPSILGQSCFSRAARWICGKHLNKSWWRNLLLLLQSSTARRWSPLRPGFSSRRAASPLLLIWRQVSLWILSSLCIYIYGGLQLEWSLSPQPPIVLVCLLLSLFTSFSFFICLLLLPFTQQLCRLSLPFFIWLLFLLSKPSGQISFSPSFLFFLKLSQLHGQALWSLEKYLRRKGNGNPVPRLSCFQMSPFFSPKCWVLVQTEWKRVLLTGVSLEWMRGKYTRMEGLYLVGGMRDLRRMGFVLFSWLYCPFFYFLWNCRLWGKAKKSDSLEKP